MRVKRRICLALVLLFFFVAIGCTKQVVVPEEVKHEYNYAQALKFFNDALESFNYYVEQAVPETQVALISLVDPTVQEANKALDSWGKALNDQTRRQAYLDLERQMVRLFLTYCPLVLQEGGV